VVEDYEPAAELERRALVRSGAAVCVVNRVRDALELLRRESFSAIVLDYQLPDGDAWSIVDLARSRIPRIPVIMVTAMGNERVAAEAMQHGVTEYVRKTGTFYDQLPEMVARVTRLAEVEERSRRCEAFAKAMLDAMPDVMFLLSVDGTFLDYRAPAKGARYRPPEKMIGGNVREVLPPALAEEYLRRVQAALDTGEMQRWEHQLPAPGGLLDCEARVVPIHPDGALAILRDLSAPAATS
jgi:CheY-like chemotaxis protein